jgi:hypothetical protein
MAARPALATGMRRACAIVVIVLAAVCAQSATAAGFQRGDVLASVGNPSVIARFAPDGTPKGELVGSSGAGPLCFDASGEHLVAPGTGLYDKEGSLLASAWAAVPLPGACTVDDAGHVFVGGGAASGDQQTGRGTIRRFDLTGHLLESYDVEAAGFAYRRVVTSLDLAPDGCTIYYDLDGSDEIKRFDACTATQLAPFGSAGPVCDHVRVLPDGRVVVTCDTYGTLLDAAGDVVHDFANPVPFGTSQRFAALDPDGTSFWMGSYQGLLTRFDIASGQQLASWVAGEGLAGVAVYSPSPPQQQSAQASLDPGATQGGAGAVAAHGHAPAAMPKLAARPTLAAARGRLIASGRSLLLDTGLRATCPAGGPACRAIATLTVVGAGARAAAAARPTRLGTLRATIAPGATAPIAVRLSRKGAAMVRGRRVVTIAVRVSVRAGNGTAVVRRASVRVRPPRSR